VCDKKSDFQVDFKNINLPIFAFFAYYILATFQHYFASLEKNSGSTLPPPQIFDVAQDYWGIFILSFHLSLFICLTSPYRSAMTSKTFLPLLITQNVAKSWNNQKCRLTHRLMHIAQPRINTGQNHSTVLNP
jgi:hypothetical protein